MSRKIYSNQLLMKDVKTLKRYIDDGAGCFVGTCRQFDIWIEKVNNLLKEYGLYIDEFEIKDPGNYVSFLDTKFCFDCEGNLQTDLHIKGTDSRSYLNFNSCHPNYIFSSIVYSQFYRLRRIINDKERLKIQLDELGKAFKNAGYPKTMVSNIKEKVLNMERKIVREEENANPRSPKEGKQAEPVCVISTYGTDENLVKTLKSSESALLNTRSFKEYKKVFRFVKRTAANIGSILVQNKMLAVGKRFGLTKPCCERNCKCCKMISKQTSIKINGKLLRSTPGSCHTYNIIYIFKCKLCNKPYIGRTTQILQVRVHEHRQAFNIVIQGAK